MAKLRSSNIEPSTATTLTLGASGDSVLVSSDSIKANTWQDVGGNSIFVSNGSGTLSSVNTALAGGGYTLISTTSTVDLASASITSGIDSTYDEYFFVLNNIYCSSTNDNYFTFQGSIDGGSNYNVAMTTTFFNSYNYDNAGASGLSYRTGMDQGDGTAYQPLNWRNNNDNISRSSYLLHLFNPSNTTYVKHILTRSCCIGPDGSTRYVQDSYVAGFFNTTSAINAISFKFTSGDIKAGTIQMYGVS